MGIRIDLSTPEGRESAVEIAQQMKLRGKRPIFELVDDGEITPKQFDALHVWFRHCAQTLQEAGIDMLTMLKQRSVEIPVTETAFKEVCYKPLLAVLEGKGSTKDQSTTDPQEVREVLHRHFAEKHNVQLPPWPTRFHDE